MVCSIADNSPLMALARELNLPPRCHSRTRDCVWGLPQASGERVMGLAGTAVGYCQAIFQYGGSPAAHTTRVTELLTSIRAPWAHSHELYWGHRAPGLDPNTFIRESMSPLVGDGRVPVVITGLDAHQDAEAIADILRTAPPVYDNETVLIRIVLRDERSCVAAAAILRRLLADSRATGRMPIWWPLLQAEFGIESWRCLQTLLGRDWRFVNVAVNPFQSEDVSEFLAPQVVVGQIVVGAPGAIDADGTISVPAAMRVLGASTDGRYSLPAYAERLGMLFSPPALIVLGPSQPTWTDDDDQQRLAELLPHLQRACRQIWHHLPPDQQDEVWRLTA